MRLIVVILTLLSVSETLLCGRLLAESPSLKYVGLLYFLAILSAAISFYLPFILPQSSANGTTEQSSSPTSKRPSEKQTIQTSAGPKEKSGSSRPSTTSSPSSEITSWGVTYCLSILKQADHELLALA